SSQGSVVPVGPPRQTRKDRQFLHFSNPLAPLWARRRTEATMANALHYKSNLRDIFFNLFEVLEIQRGVLGNGAYANLDETTVRDSLTQLVKLAETGLAASFVEGDRTPLTFAPETGDVKIPEGLKKSINAWFEGGWHLLEVPERLGGIGAPPSVCWAANELI